MTNHPGAFVVFEGVLFIATMALVLKPATKAFGEYVGIGFHLLLLVLIFSAASRPAGQAAGCLWVVCDVVASVGSLWNRRSSGRLQAEVFTPIRMAGHLSAAVWIVSVSLLLGLPGLIVGIALAFGFAAYTLAAGRLPEKALALPGLLLVVWLLLLARPTKLLAG